MPEWLRTTLGDVPAVSPPLVMLRLTIAFVLGVAVAWIYRRTRATQDIMPTFSATLVLLAILIAMVTQVIGDNVARAFSLVGALSIVRFRTVVRDTQDTAYVIFAVVIGMAVGAADLWVAGIGLVITGVAAWAMRSRPAAAAVPIEEWPFLLHVRLGAGQDAHALLAPALKSHTVDHRLLSVSTAKQGLLMDVAYAARLADDQAAEPLVRTLNALDGVQSVELQRRETATDA
jgi:hypothetical protein